MYLSNTGMKLFNLLLAQQSGKILCRHIQYQPVCYLSSKSIVSPAVSHEDIQPQSVLEELKIPFSRALIGNFFQDQPRLGNQFLEDSLLQGYLKRHLPPVVLKEASQDLERFGQRLVDEIDSLGRECELNQPHLQQYDAWGRRVDRIITCPAWQRMKVVSAEEGLVAEGYERKYSSWSRLIQIVKLYLYSPSSGCFHCPLAMTDGAAKVIESLGMPEALQDAFRHLTSRDPKRFWTSGQWMTERRGGSDVAHGTETVAHAQADGTYKLYGYKWFTSATDSDMTLTLGRVIDAQGHVMSGTKGLSLFYLEVRDAEGELNGIEIQRLKEKLGTRQLPTAELLLDGVKALRVQARGAFLLLMEVARLLGLEETNMATVQDQNVLRLLTPIAKLYTGKQAVAVISEGLECFGGQGYMEDTGLPTLLRDAQVLTIWEGTTNILSLDVLRSVRKSQGQVLSAYFSATQEMLEGSSNVPGLSQPVSRLLQALQNLKVFTHKAGERGSNFMELAARDFAYSLAKIYIGCLFVEHAAWAGAKESDVYCAQRWTEQDLCPVSTAETYGCYDLDTASMERHLVYEKSPLLKGKL
ncbi:acyl-CoA dehydrogenase family member 11-like isoform X2 [Dendrobates tinctorius]|uniref:acyl-CoA dehydrogenase family member 11-like isoform X2 n=1 Tax=Dendrobates tinctorius TaxID=92724 RepID=UPI003CCA437D